MSFSDYDPITDAIYFLDANNVFWRYVPSTNTQTRFNSIYTGGSTRATGVVDYGHKYFFLIGSGLFWRADLTVATPSISDIASRTSGCSTLINAGYPGLAYDPVQNKIIGSLGGPNVIVLDPATLTCTTQTYSSGPPALNTSTQTGVFGHFRYFPALGVFAAYTDTTQNGWVLRMTPAAGGGISGPVISAVNVDSITTTTANVTWTTDVPSTTQVEYGTSTAYGDQPFPSAGRFDRQYSIPLSRVLEEFEWSGIH
jgi:hypothetical protein